MDWNGLEWNEWNGMDWNGMKKKIEKNFVRKMTK